jgi:hypothetical protein
MKRRHVSAALLPLAEAYSQNVALRLQLRDTLEPIPHFEYPAIS